MNTLSEKPVRGGSGKLRNSNLELYRIITMLLIIAHHYVVNSGLTHVGGPVLSAPTATHSVVLLLVGEWGKTGINCFVIITGYFMCKSCLTARKYAKLYFEVLFYRVTSFIVLLALGKTSVSIVGLIKLVLPFSDITSNNFTSCFMAFYLFIPFINILVNKMTQKQHFYLTVLSLLVFCIFATIPYFDVVCNYIVWFIILYLVSSYVRLYPNKLFDNTAFWGVATLISMMLSMASVLFFTFFHGNEGIAIIYEFVMDSNTFLAFLTGFSSFMFFKNLKIGHSKVINTVASVSFGVFLIHASLRTILWTGILKNVQWYNSPYYWLHLILSVLGIYLVCGIIDFARQKLIEKPFFILWDKNWDKFKSKFEKTEVKILKGLGIKQEV